MPTNTGLKEAVFIYGLDNDRQTTREFAITLNEWACKSDNEKRPIRFNMNSGGGLILDSLFLGETFSHLRRRGHFLTGAAYGRASSCAAWLLQLFDVRIIGAESWLLVHQVSSEMKGPIDVMKAEIARCEDLQEQTDNLLIRRTNGKLTRAIIGEHISGGRDWWINAHDAKNKWGLVDVVEETPEFQPYQAS